ncbi:fructose-6-phosphate aldolase [Hydrogenibacillus schlegelii]|uniref:Probable transaldolase n=1 Tax=Hydrogenibacillus schlegelii TaxID=1484 RepID=A0A132N916_HYDSH|nr:MULTISPECIES: fructose-6-phosphate aldolase [Hydrogenibacillus]KWX06618.1 transaldolase [Hydrogenibacillus schlegelii]OAR04191.1 fructose-6-phosphate aldolase [Hydrogenibacillus schlegelii]PTQ54540.1 MAG: Transaldolase-like fructose-6-phosphate aldolase [Hydrogenibacillus schlegelii]QZA32974.1 fructose-6-phosphate aldolase [Hydrogenibacillus sp. N12]
MKLFLDSANIEEIREAHALGVLSGVTTNPTLVAKEGRDFHTVIKEIIGIVSGPVSAEVIATDADGMVEEGKRLFELGPNVVIKVPLTKEGLRATDRLARLGIPTNVTLVFTLNQALVAARAGATYVSPFVGRLDDIGHDGIALVEDIVQVFERHHLDTEVIAASIRHPEHVARAARAGAHIATVPYAVLMKLIEHPLTAQGLERFLADWRRARGAEPVPGAGPKGG